MITDVVLLGFQVVNEMSVSAIFGFVGNRPTLYDVFFERACFGSVDVDVRATFVPFILLLKVIYSHSLWKSGKVK